MFDLKNASITFQKLAQKVVETITDWALNLSVALEVDYNSWLEHHQGVNTGFQDIATAHRSL